MGTGLHLLHVDLFKKYSKIHTQNENKQHKDSVNPQLPPRLYIARQVRWLSGNSQDKLTDRRTENC